MGRPGRHALISDADRGEFPIGRAVRYKPGVGTYGYEDLLEADGRIPAVVEGYSATKVRLRFTVGRVRGTTRAVEPSSVRSGVGLDR